MIPVIPMNATATIRQANWLRSPRSSDTMFPMAPRPLAPATYLGFQEGFGSVHGFHLFNLTADVTGHPTGSTVSDGELLKLGFRLPPIPCHR